MRYLAALPFVHLKRRKKGLIEGNEMMSSKKLTCKGTWRASVYLPEAQNPIPPPLHTNTVYVYIVYLFTQGRGRRESERRGEGRVVT
jgi:hypothetical protein